MDTKKKLAAFAGACLLFANTALAAGSSLSVPLSMQNNESNDRILPDKWHRMPAYISCTIDFAAGTIESGIESPILSYELWDEDGVDMLISFGSPQEFTHYMSTLTGSYQLRLVTEEYLYIGYLEL